jgi:hypothetical protein
MQYLDHLCCIVITVKAWHWKGSEFDLDPAIDIWEIKTN